VSSHQPQILEFPFPEKRLLLHSCCAPCSGSIMASLQAEHIDFTVFFYNPNIHPTQEYEIRKAENKRFADKNHIPFVDSDYDTDFWFERVKGFENAPERGKRCTLCFDIRLECTARYAHENSFSVFTSSLGISRWKNMAQVNDCGVRAATLYDNLTYWTFNWRKKGGSEKMLEIAKREQFYRQEYCGCVYSLRDSNRWRKSQGREIIRR